MLAEACSLDCVSTSWCATAELVEVLGSGASVCLADGSPDKDVLGKVSGVRGAGWTSLLKERGRMQSRDRSLAEQPSFLCICFCSFFQGEQGYVPCLLWKHWVESMHQEEWREASGGLLGHIIASHDCRQMGVPDSVLSVVMDHLSQSCCHRLHRPLSQPV